MVALGLALVLVVALWVALGLGLAIWVEIVVTVALVVVVALVLRLALELGLALVVVVTVGLALGLVVALALDMSRHDWASGFGIPSSTETSKERKMRRKQEKRHGRFGGPQFEAYVRRLPCCVTGQNGIDIAHLDHAGMGGTDRDAHTNNLVPLVREMHRQLDLVLGIEGFNERYGIDLEEIARVVTQGFKNRWLTDEVRRRWKKYGGR